MLASSTLLVRSDTVIDASGMRLAVITVSVSLRDACAWIERGDALSGATGVPYDSPLATAQSSAFSARLELHVHIRDLRSRRHQWPAVGNESQPLGVAVVRYQDQD